MNGNIKRTAFKCKTAFSVKDTMMLKMTSNELNILQHNENKHFLKHLQYTQYNNYMTPPNNNNN